MKATQPEIFKKHTARMESLLAELIEAEQLSLDALVVRPRSLFRRGYSSDITDVATVAESDLTGYLYPFEQHATGSVEKIPKPSRKSNKTITVVDVSREGMYDALPEYLFHAPEAIAGSKIIDQRLRESEKAQEEEARARKFFLPFEQEFFREQIRAEQEEIKLLSGFSNPIQHVILQRFWSDVTGIEPLHEAVLFYLLPSAYKIAGNKPLMEACFEAVLQDPVHIGDAPVHATDDVPNENIPGLGSASLGFDLVLGNFAVEDMPDLAVNIGPISLDGLAEYLDGGKKNNLLTILYSHFVPAVLDVRTQFVLQKMEDGFVLNEDEGSARLDYSTYL